MNIWRLHSKPSMHSEYDIAKEMIDNNFAGLGWSMMDDRITALLQKGVIDESKAEKMRNKRQNIKSTEDYCNLYMDFYPEDKTVNENVNRLQTWVNSGDLIWIRRNGVYWLGKVTDKSCWTFNKEYIKKDLANQISNIHWVKIGDEGNVPGKVASAFISTKTFQRIKHKGIATLSMLLFNEKCKDESLKYSEQTIRDSIEKTDNGKQLFFNYISDFECEDILCLWLQFEKGYMVIPSTSKKGTELYECVLINKDGRRAYPQVKNGKDTLYCDDYKELCKDNDVYLFTVNGNVIGNPIENITVVDSEEIYNFARENRVLMSEAVNLWLDYIDLFHIAYVAIKLIMSWFKTNKCKPGHIMSAQQFIHFRSTIKDGDVVSSLGKAFDTLLDKGYISLNESKDFVLTEEGFSYIEKTF